MLKKRERGFTSRYGAVVITSFIRGDHISFILFDCDKMWGFHYQPSAEIAKRFFFCFYFPRWNPENDFVSIIRQNFAVCVDSQIGQINREKETAIYATNLINVVVIVIVSNHHHPGIYTVLPHSRSQVMTVRNVFVQPTKTGKTGEWRTETYKIESKNVTTTSYDG